MSNGHTLPISQPPVTSQTKDVMWRDMHGRDLKPSQLEDSHLANVIHHIMQRPGYSKEVFEAMVNEANLRGFSQEYLDGAPYPFTDSEGREVIADYSDGMKLIPYVEIDRYTLKIGSSVIGISLDPTVFGDPVMKDDLPVTTKEAKYTSDDIIPWTHDLGASMMTYWMGRQPPVRSLYDAVMTARKKQHVLLKVFQDNQFDITHLIVESDDLILSIPHSP